MAKQVTSPKRAKKQTAKKSAARKAKQQPVAPAVYTVFISHSAKDSELAKDLARRLEEVGVESLYVGHKAETNEAASKWRLAISMYVRASDEVIVLLTDNSADSPWLRYEMGVADSMDKRLTPVIVNEGVEQRVPMVGKHFIKYADLPKYISSLKRRAKAA